MARLRKALRKELRIRAGLTAIVEHTARKRREIVYRPNCIRGNKVTAHPAQTMHALLFLRRPRQGSRGLAFSVRAHLDELFSAGAEGPATCADCVHCLDLRRPESGAVSLR